MVSVYRNICGDGIPSRPLSVVHSKTRRLGRETDRWNCGQLLAVFASDYL